MAERAGQVAWLSDATTVWLPATEADLWHIVTNHPVRSVYLPMRRDIVSERFLSTFIERPDCGKGFYDRR